MTLKNGQNSDGLLFRNEAQRKTSGVKEKETIPFAGLLEREGKRKRYEKRSDLHFYEIKSWGVHYALIGQEGTLEKYETGQKPHAKGNPPPFWGTTGGKEKQQRKKGRGLTLPFGAPSS